MKPKISVIVSARNSKRFIAGCLDNLLTQTIAEKLEIILVHCGQERAETAIIQKYLKEHASIRYYPVSPPESLYASWNRAIKLARGTYIVSANVDDRSRLDAFEIMADALDRNPRAALVYSDFFFTSRANERGDFKNHRERHWTPCRVPEYSHKMLLLRAFCGARPLWRKALHKRIGYFNENYFIAADYDFWLRIAERYAMLHLPAYLCLYYRNRHCLSLRYRGLLLREQREIRKKYFNLKDNPKRANNAF